MRAYNICACGLIACFVMAGNMRGTASPSAEPGFDTPPALVPVAPLAVPPISYFDIATGKFGSLDLTLKDGEFASAGVGALHLVANSLDLTRGVLKDLTVEFDGGRFKDFKIDHLSMSSQGNLCFDTGALLTHRVLQFLTPATAQVVAEISQSSLNDYINSPLTLQKLSVTAGQKMAALTALLGGDFGLVFSHADITLQESERLKLNATARFGAGDQAVPVPISADSHIGLSAGWPNLDDTHIVTAGAQLPPEISGMLVSKINSLSGWGEKSNDIHFEFDSLKVLPGDKIVLQGRARIYRLVFGKRGED